MSRYKQNSSKQSLFESSKDSGPISSTLHDNLNIEVELCDFYAILLQKLYQKFQMEYSLICKAFHRVRTIRETNEPPILTNYETNDTRFAYLFKFSIIHSVLMYDRFRDMMKENPCMLKKIFSVSKLNICILGGGPGFEAAAICMFLKKAIAIFKSDKNSQLLIHITVIDMCAKWETELRCLFTSLQKVLHPNIEVDVCFIQADLAEELSPVVIQAIKSSYIITMFKFVNEVFDRCGSEKVEKMIEDIVGVMSFDSCLFFLDNAGGKHFRIANEVIYNIPCTTRFYGPKYHHCQELKIDTVEKYSFFLQDIFKTLQCSSKTTISCSAWLKLSNAEQDDISSSYEKNVDTEQNSEKKKRKRRLKKISIGRNVNKSNECFDFVKSSCNIFTDKCIFYLIKKLFCV